MKECENKSNLFIARSLIDTVDDVVSVRFLNFTQEKGKIYKMRP